MKDLWHAYIFCTTYFLNKKQNEEICDLYSAWCLLQEQIHIVLWHYIDHWAIDQHISPARRRLIEFFCYQCCFLLQLQISTTTFSSINQMNASLPTNACFQGQTCYSTSTRQNFSIKFGNITAFLEISKQLFTWHDIISKIL